jgi:hypothetical protein
MFQTRNTEYLAAATYCDTSMWYDFDKTIAADQLFNEEGFRWITEMEPDN